MWYMYTYIYMYVCIHHVIYIMYKYTHPIYTHKHTHTHTHTHTLEYYLAIKNKWNNASYSKMDGPTDYHTKWSKLEKNKYHIILPHIWNLENDTHELTYKIHKTNSQTWKSNSLVAKGEMPRGGIKQEIEIHRYTLLYMK